MSRYHPGICDATEWGKHYGKNISPKGFDDPEHQWHFANDKNWGPWSCCARPANSPGCQLRVVDPSYLAAMPSSTSSDAGRAVEGEKRIKFLDRGNVCRVVAEEKNCWRLDDGRVAKKKTEGKVWTWVKGR